MSNNVKRLVRLNKHLATVLVEFEVEGVELSPALSNQSMLLHIYGIHFNIIFSKIYCVYRKCPSSNNVLYKILSSKLQ